MSAQPSPVVHQDEDTARAAAFRARVLELEAAMMAMHEQQVQIKTTHTFAPGLYMREIFVPKGTMLTGKIQKTEYLNILSAGDISVMTEHGMKRVAAPAVLRSHPGLKRAGYAHEDTAWLTVHQNPENIRDIDTLEDMLFAETFEEAPAAMAHDTEAPVVTYQGKSSDPEATYLASKRTLVDVFAALGTNPEQMRLESEFEGDQAPFPVEPEAVRIGDSPIHGKGVFAARAITKGEVLAPARIDGKRTPAGRYGNHGGEPNGAMIMLDNGDVNLVSIRDIAEGEEVLSDYFLNYLYSRRAMLEGGV